MFGLRRGFERLKERKYKKYISSKEIIRILKLTNIGIEQFEKNIESLKLGTSGRVFNLNLPKKIDLKTESIDTGERALAEAIYSKKFKESIIEPKINKEKYFYLTSKSINKSRKDKYLDKSIPNKIEFDNSFAKEFGKWIGD